MIPLLYALAVVVDTALQYANILECKFNLWWDEHCR